MMILFYKIAYICTMNVSKAQTQLKALRKSRGLTQKKIAEIMDISVQAYSRIETSPHCSISRYLEAVDVVGGKVVVVDSKMI